MSKQSVENTWPEKISYSLSTPTKGVIFGTAIRVDFRIIPLLKALEIGHVTTELVETQEMTVHNPKHPRQSKTARVIVKDKWKLPNDIETEEVDGQDAYVFQRQLNIPKNLRHCVQSIEIPGIKIRHTLNFNVQLLNPDGHISEVTISYATQLCVEKY